MGQFQADLSRSQWVEVFTRNLPDNWVEQYAKLEASVSPAEEVDSPLLLDVLLLLVLFLALPILAAFIYLRLANQMTLKPKTREQTKRDSKWTQTSRELKKGALACFGKLRKKRKPATTSPPPSTKKGIIYQAMVQLATDRHEDGPLMQLLSSRKPLNAHEKAFPADFPCIDEQKFLKGTVPRYQMTTKVGDNKAADSG